MPRGEDETPILTVTLARVKPHRQAYELLPDGSAKRRREPAGRIAWLVLLALLLTTGVGWAVWNLTHEPRVATDASTASTAATVTDSSTPTAAPTPSAVPTERMPPRTISGAGLPTIPDDFALPHESDSAWTGANLSLDLCSSLKPEKQALANATDLHTIETTNGDTSSTETLALTADQGASAQIVRDFSHAVTDCPDDSEPRASGTATVANLADDGHHRQTSWDEATILALSLPQSPGSDVTYLLLARADRAVVIASVSGPDTPAPRGSVLNAGIVARLQQFADTMASKVCVFRTDKCAPPWVGSDGQVTLPPDSVELPNGNTVLPDGTIIDPSGQVVLGDSSPPSPTTPVPTR